MTLVRSSLLTRVLVLSNRPNGPIIREHHGSGPCLSTTRPIQQHSEDLDNLRNNSKLLGGLPPPPPPATAADHINNLLNRCSDAEALLYSMDSLILTSMAAKPEYTAVDMMPPVYPYPSTNAILQGDPI